MIWTAEIDTKLLELLDSGVSTSKIGEILGTSKSSVVGRHRRLLIKAGLKPPDPPKKRTSKAKRLPIIDAHPAFDPVDGIWFLEEPNLEAKTISELLNKLPKGSTIKDYVVKGS